LGFENRETPFIKKKRKVEGNGKKRRTEGRALTRSATSKNSTPRGLTTNEGGTFLSERGKGSPGQKIQRRKGPVRGVRKGSYGKEPLKNMEVLERTCRGEY